MTSTLKAYWEGKKALFQGLKIAELEEKNKDAWKTYPVFYFDFNGNNYHDTSIETVLDGMLFDWEMIYGDQFKDRTLGDRFQKILEIAAQKTGLELHSHIKEVFKGFLVA